MAAKLRKRFLVTEGDLFRIYREVREIRDTEKRELYMKEFRQLMRDAQEVIITPKTATDGKRS